MNTTNPKEFTEDEFKQYKDFFKKNPFNIRKTIYEVCI